MSGSSTSSEESRAKPSAAKDKSFAREANNYPPSLSSLRRSTLASRRVSEFAVAAACRKLVEETKTLDDDSDESPEPAAAENTFAFTVKRRVSLAAKDGRQSTSDGLRLRASMNRTNTCSTASFKENDDSDDDSIEENGVRRSSVYSTISMVPQCRNWDPTAEDEKNSQVDNAVALPAVERLPEGMGHLRSLRRRLSKNYDNTEERYMELPASTHTLLHTEPVASIPFLFSLGIALLSAACLLLVLVHEMSGGRKENWFDVPTGVGYGVRGAQYCGIFVGVLMEEEIPQALILLRSISKKSFRATYPGLSYTRFILSCLLRLTMGYLFLLNLFITIVQADDVITIFFDILALEFVQHLDDVAFGLARKDVLGRYLYVAASMKYKVLTREAYTERRERIDRLKNRIDEEKAFKKEARRDTGDTEESSDTNQESPSEEPGFYYFRRRQKKKFHCRWLIKASYFINTLLLLTGTIIVMKHQSELSYHCKSLTVMFGEEVFEDAFVTDMTDPSQPLKRQTVVYSYFNGVYKITKTDEHGYPVYTEMNKISGNQYRETAGAEFVYCEKEGAWVFRHKAISKDGISSDEEDACSQDWLFRSPPTTAYDLIGVPLEGWSMWTGVVTPKNQMSIVCNTCKSKSDCNYHGKCGEDGECSCEPEFFGFHCEFPAFCEKLIDDKGEMYTAATHSNKTLFSYGRPIYHRHGRQVQVLIQHSVDEADSFVSAAEEFTSGNSASDQSRTLATACHPKARKIRLKSNTESQIAMYEFEVYSSGVNVALQGTAFQSSNRNNGQFLYASNAIDGNFSTFSHTNDQDAMFEVDLGYTYPIESVHIVNRSCGKNPAADPLDCRCRLSNATLTLINDMDLVVATKTLGNTCDEMTVSVAFTSSHDCQTDNPTDPPTTKSPTNYPTSQPVTLSPSLRPTASPNTPPTTRLSSSLPTADPVAKSIDDSTDLVNEVAAQMDNSMLHSDGGHNAFSTFDDAIMSLQTGDMVLVYSGSRWFGTRELSAEKDFNRLASLYDEEYHAFWDDLYNGKMFFISDPTTKATPVGVDFYHNVRSGTLQWKDYGPFGLLTPVANITGQGFLHCLGSNISAV